MARATNYTEMGDAELVEAVLAERPGAWQAFFARFERLIISCVRRVLLRYGAYHSEEDIEDLVSATALNIIKDDYKKLRAFDPTRGYRLSSWVGLLATNTAHDALRQRPPTAESIDSDSSSRVYELPANTVDPAERILREEQAQRLARAITQLSPSEQLFVRFYFEDELEPEQIAQLMQISVNTVYSRKNKVREKLRRIIEAEQAREEGPEDLRKNRQEQ
jgi:RNA polymerase sigma-70 factor (ECF subfamily)